MSIRKKLLLSYAAMILIPALLLGVAMPVIFHAAVGEEPWWTQPGVQGPDIETLQRFRFLAPVLLGGLIAVIVLTGSLLAYYVSRSIIVPLGELRRAAERIKDGSLDEPLRNERKDEIGELGSAFENMRRRLLDSVDLQLRYEENRKELIASISHDLKTPITAIAACVEALQDGIADTPQRRQSYYGMIRAKTARLDALIEELFLFSKLDLQRQSFHWETVDLRALLQDYADELAHQPGYDRISFRVETPSDGDPVTVTADREKLTRVLTNLVSNSLRYLPPAGGKLVLGLTANNEAVSVSVRDNGSGIPAERLPFIFDRFYRGDPSRGAESGGSGLGLAIVKQIVEAHGGVVTAASEPGRWTELRITLPRHHKPEGKGGAHPDEENTHR